MNITSISTNYNTVKNTQNFGSIYASAWVRENCGLTDSDIESLNCPSGLDVYVDDYGTDGYYLEVARAHITYIGKPTPYPYEDFDVSLYDRGSYDTKQKNKSNFMDCMKEIIASYHRRTGNSN